MYLDYPCLAVALDTQPHHIPLPIEDQFRAGGVSEKLQVGDLRAACPVEYPGEVPIDDTPAQPTAVCGHRRCAVEHPREGGEVREVHTAGTPPHCRHPQVEGGGVLRFAIGRGSLCNTPHGSAHRNELIGEVHGRCQVACGGHHEDHAVELRVPPQGLSQPGPGVLRELHGFSRGVEGKGGVHPRDVDHRQVRSKQGKPTRSPELHGHRLASLDGEEGGVWVLLNQPREHDCSGSTKTHHNYICLQLGKGGRRGSRRTGTVRASAVAARDTPRAELPQAWIAAHSPCCEVAHRARPRLGSLSHESTGNEHTPYHPTSPAHQTPLITPVADTHFGHVHPALHCGCCRPQGTLRRTGKARCLHGVEVVEVAS
eukprot:Sspe_Gene.77489::Locus_48426_Transcript_1_1_Confidence_1.000_Length_2872::g.77489::m.77489